jgi:hypothetical protein
MTVVGASLSTGSTQQGKGKKRATLSGHHDTDAARLDAVAPPLL